MSERPGPDLDRVREALRGHDERHGDDPATAPGAPDESATPQPGGAPEEGASPESPARRDEPEDSGDEPENVAGAG